MNLTQWLESQRDFFEQRLPKYLPSGCPKLLLEAMEYSLLSGGKRLRPILTFAAAEVCGGTKEVALPGAVAVEMIHTYSLIHDDLPAMDDDDLRRGQPTSHKVFGEAVAILAGDALLTHAFSVVAQSDLPPATAMAIARELAHCAGPLGMVGGQVLDVAGTDDLAAMYDLKTGALLRAAVRTGALVAGAAADAVAALSRYATALGLCFQITDDLLDVAGNEQLTGKTAGSDARRGKATYVTRHGVDGARAIAREKAREAQNALNCLAGDVRMLEELARHVADRSR